VITPASIPAVSSSRVIRTVIPLLVEIPVLHAEVVRERADAARNRRRILAAAERLFASRGVTGVTMDDIAAEAEVGKGTLYRRFGDKSGLGVSLLDERERELQQHILGGPPPLGPGASPAARLAAFAEAYLLLVRTHLDLILLSQTSVPGARLRTGSHVFWCQHCRYLLTEAHVPDAGLRAHMLLAGLTGEQVRHWIDDTHLDPADLSSAIAAVAVALTHVLPRPMAD
jgi:AcrR family transcriptional regulator